MGLTHTAIGTAAPIGALAGNVFVRDPRMLALMLSSVVLTSPLPALAGFDAHRYEDTALRSPRRLEAACVEPDSVRRIRALAAYEAGWDGPDSVGPTLETVKQAVAFARDLHALGEIVQPRISLAGDGEINFYWKTPQLVLDLGFTGTGRFSYYGRTPDGVEFVEDEAELGHALPADLIAILRV